jgi:hypothetical protein
MDKIKQLDHTFAKWIEEKCDLPSYSRKGLAAAMGLTESVISKITTGVRQMKASEFELACRYFGERPSSLAKEAASGVGQVGIVEAGVYRDEDAMRRAVVGSPDFSPENFPGFRSLR